MSYQSLYRKYRPQHFGDVVGQTHIVEVLEKSIQKDRISHAYLFCGPRGTGKTSLAKLMAGAINCTHESALLCGECENCRAFAAGNHADIVEIDAASNNGVDEIRGLIERVKYSPILGRKKVYIIDEVHMLSQGAFNALLKTLEEPPEHVVFILATTEVHKVIPTIISRCQRFDFTRIETQSIARRLDSILDKEGVKAEPGVTSLIASLSGGGLRNALTILEQAIVSADAAITTLQIYESFGMVTPQDKIDLFTSLAAGDAARLLEILDTFKQRSVNTERVVLDLITNLKDSYVMLETGSRHYLDENQKETIEFLSKSFSSEHHLYIINKLIQAMDRMKFSQNQDIYFEVCLLELLQAKRIESKQTKDKEVIRESVTETTKVSLQQEAVKEEKAPEVFEPETDEADDSPVATIMETETVTVEKKVEKESEVVTQAQNPSQEASSTIAMDLDDEILLSMMVSADKQIRIQDERKFSSVTAYRTDLKWAKPSRLISSGNLVLSGEQFVLISLETEYEAREVMQQQNRNEILNFSEIVFGTRKHVLAVTQKQFSEAVQEFRKRLSEKTLPQALEDDFFTEMAAGKEEKEEQKEEILKSVTDLFGDDLEIVE